MEAITVRQLLTAVHGTLLGDFSDLDKTVTHLQRDSRIIEPDDVFLPLVGERRDGHAYIESALDAGAAGTLTMHPQEHYQPGKFYILVEDTLKALGDLARWYRSLFSFPVIGITGSAGKTTTKDMIAAVLGEKFRVLKTQENYNNDIGLPETILSLTRQHNMAVIEMGMNHLEEIDYLTGIAKPDVAVIINVGYAHIENLGSREGILQAKCEIFHGMNPDTGLAVLNGEDEMLATVSNYPVPVIWCGQGAGCTSRCLSIRPEGDDGMVMDAEVLGEPMTFHIPAAGAHMRFSVLMAAAIGKTYGMTAEEIGRGVAHFVPSGKRMLRMPRKNRITLIDDTYNANPAAVQAVLEILSARPEGKKVAVLGDMFELGDQGPALHAQCGRYAGEKHIDVLLAIGPLSRHTAQAAEEAGVKKVRWFATKEAARAALAEEITGNTALLFKASHGMKFAELVAYAMSITQAE
jgi:UDP-N-acetylmuramoyl-tripeptide--D-alanyl-D-alanine ligase